ncbi:S1C family serine protease [Patescibacteria group bacterium]|nr:S1C family serine protease [Patescibacteria group bacterium]
MTAKSGVKTAPERKNRENQARFAKIAADNSVRFAAVDVLRGFAPSSRWQFLNAKLAAIFWLFSRYGRLEKHRIIMPKKKDYKKIIGFWLLVFLVGGLAGVFFSRAFLPWLTSFSPFNKVAWLYNVNEATTIINKTEKIYVSEDTAYQEAINKIGNAVVAVRVEKTGRIAIENSGFILTSDGLIATANFSLAKDAKILVLRDNQEYEAQLVKQDATNDIALIKITANNLPIVDFGDSQNLSLGERVVLVGASKIGDTFSKFTNIGVIKTFSPEISFSFSESSLADGAALGNIEGKVLGLVLTNKQGSIKLVGEDKIRELMK